MNLLHEQYKQSLKKELLWIRFYQMIIVIAFFMMWEFASYFKWIDELIFSSPSRIIKLFIVKLGDGTLLLHSGATLFETVLGFILGTFVGTLLATILWWYPKLSKVLDPYLVILNAMPKVALGPILIVILGPSFIAIITMGALVSVIISTLVIYTAFKNIDANYLKVLSTFKASRMQMFKEAVLPASFPTIISTLKVNVGLSWVGVIVGEFLVSSKGLGYLIISGFQVFNFDLVLLSLMVIAIFATLMYRVVDLVEKRFITHD